MIYPKSILIIGAAGIGFGVYAANTNTLKYLIKRVFSSHKTIRPTKKITFTDEVLIKSEIHRLKQSIKKQNEAMFDKCISKEIKINQIGSNGKKAAKDKFKNLIKETDKSEITRYKKRRTPSHLQDYPHWDFEIDIEDIRDPNQPAFSSDTTFFDNFEDGDAMSWTPVNFDRWSIANEDGSKAYLINTSNYTSNDGKPTEYALVNHSQYEDFIFTCKAKTKEPLPLDWYADICFLFGYQDDQNYYFYYITKIEGQSGLYKVQNGDKESLSLKSGGYYIGDNDYHDVKII